MSDGLKKLVLDGRKEGKVVFFALEDTLCSADVKEFIKQPTNGILWDLNRLEEVALSRTHKPRWVNDFAVALTIRALKDRIAQLEAGLEETDGYLDFERSQNAKLRAKKDMWHKEWNLVAEMNEKLEEDYTMLQKGMCGTNAELSKAWDEIESLKADLLACRELAHSYIEAYEKLAFADAHRDDWSIGLGMIP